MECWMLSSLCIDYAVSLDNPIHGTMQVRRNNLTPITQVVTIGNAEDLTGSENKASYGTQLTYNR